MPFWLTNPNHGVMPVYSRGDVGRHAAMGWTLLNEGESPLREPTAEELAPVIAQLAEDIDREVLAQVVSASGEKRKPGRPRKG